MHLKDEAGFEVQVNGDIQRLPGGASVARLLEEMGLAGRRVAVAVNREIVHRARYDERILLEGDRVEVLEAVGGGR
jgi:sulfur carrier protein